MIETSSLLRTTLNASWTIQKIAQGYIVSFPKAQWQSLIPVPTGNIRRFQNHPMMSECDCWGPQTMYVTSCSNSWKSAYRSTGLLWLIYGNRRARPILVTSRLGIPGNHQCHIFYSPMIAKHSLVLTQIESKSSLNKHTGGNCFFFVLFCLFVFFCFFWFVLFCFLFCFINRWSGYVVCDQILCAHFVKPYIE